MADRPASSSVHPYIQARRMGQAMDGERFADAFLDSDLNALGLPPEGLALVGGHPAGLTWDGDGGALDVALWLALVLHRTGLLVKVQTLYGSATSTHGPGGYVWRAPERAARSLALALGDALTTEAERAGVDAIGAAPVPPAPRGRPAGSLTVERFAAAVPAVTWFAGVARRAGVADVLREFFRARPSNDVTPWRQVSGAGAVDSARSHLRGVQAWLASEEAKAAAEGGADA